MKTRKEISTSITNLTAFWASLGILAVLVGTRVDLRRTLTPSMTTEPRVETPTPANRMTQLDNPYEAAQQLIGSLRNRLPDLTATLPPSSRPEQRFALDDSGRLVQSLWFEKRSTMESWYQSSVTKSSGQVISRHDYLTPPREDRPVLVVLTLTPIPDNRRLGIMEGTMEVYDAENYVRPKPKVRPAAMGLSVQD